MAGGVFSSAKLNAMTIRESATDGSDFTNPDADYRRLFLGEDGLLYVRDSAGAVTSPYAAATAPFVGCSIYHSATQNPGDPAVLAFDSEVYDTDTFHDTVTNNSRVTIPTGKGGKYLFTWASASTGTTAMRLKKNGTTIIGPNGYDDNGNACVVVLVATDYVELERSGAGTLGHASAFEAQTQLTASLLGT